MLLNGLPPNDSGVPGIFKEGERVRCWGLAGVGVQAMIALADVVNDISVSPLPGGVADAFGAATLSPPSSRVTFVVVEFSAKGGGHAEFLEVPTSLRGAWGSTAT